MGTMSQNLTYTHPHNSVEVNDKSVRFPNIIIPKPLMKPLYFVKAEKGRPNIPFYGNANELMTEFGDGLFEKRYEGFNHQSVFLKRAVGHNRCMVVRITDDEGAKEGSLVLAMVVANVSGKVHYKFKTYSLAEVNTITSRNDVEYHNVPTWKENVTIEGTSQEATVYPLYAATFGSVGKYANKSGIRLFFDSTTDPDAMGRTRSILFDIGFIETKYGKSTPVFIRNKYDLKTTKFSFMDSAFDAKVSKSYGYKNVSGTDMTDEDAGVKKPYTDKIYGENYKTVANMVITVDPSLANDDDIKDDPYLINLITGRRYDDNAVAYANYEAMEDVDAIGLTKSYNIKFKDGSDGNLTNDKYEEKIQQWCNAELYVKMLDEARYPFNVVVDSGFKLPTKKALIRLQSHRDDVFTFVSTMIANDRPQTTVEQSAVAVELEATALMYVESGLHGTASCRTAIQRHSALLPNDAYPDYIPALTYDIVDKLFELNNSPKNKGSVTTSPKNVMKTFAKSYFEDAPHSPPIRELMWKMSSNYLQYKDDDNLFFADLKTVYRHEYSVLSSLETALHVCFVKQICRKVWTRHVGNTKPYAEYTKDYLEDLTKDLVDAFGTKYEFTNEVVANKLDSEKGNAITVRTKMACSLSQRVIHNDIELHRLPTGGE